MAQLRPGPLFYHDAKADADCKALREFYAFVFSDKPARPPNSSAVFLYCEPFRVFDETKPNATFASLSTPHLGNATVSAEDEAVRGVFQQSDNVPSWVASSERFVEFYKRRLADLPNNGPGLDSEATEIRSALTRIQSTIAKSVDR
jgi:hypothetical protein